MVAAFGWQTLIGLREGGGGGGGGGVSVSCGSLLVGRFPSPEAVLPLVLWVPAPGQDRYE